MFVAERLEMIRNILIEQKTVNISTLCELLNVSDVTVRKDLENLEKDNFLKKIHGGAVLVSRKEELSAGQETVVPHYTEKVSIAEKAVSLIDEFDNIFIGPGTSCYIFSKLLHSHKNVRVITNNINALNLLVNSVKKVQVIGGEMGHRDNQMFTVGIDDCSELDNIILNKAIVTYNGIDSESGYTLDEIDLVNIYSKVFSISKEVIVLAPDYKFGLHSMYHSRNIEELDYIITNKIPEKNFTDRINNTKVKLLLAGK